jgi:hypothetical protein
MTIKEDKKVRIFYRKVGCVELIVPDDFNSMEPSEQDLLVLDLIEETPDSILLEGFKDYNEEESANLGNQLFDEDPEYIEYQYFDEEGDTQVRYL